jgi:hypothetical protein
MLSIKNQKTQLPLFSEQPECEDASIASMYKSDDGGEQRKRDVKSELKHENSAILKDVFNSNSGSSLNDLLNQISRANELLASNSKAD